MISTLGQQRKSILLSSYLSFSTRKLHCVSLVDSGCTAKAFLDRTFVKDHGIPTTRLPTPRPLYLADGKLRDWIREYTTLDFQIDAHSETLSFFITSLAPENPVIMGIPWLAQHSPQVDWTTLDITFANCGPACFPPGAPTTAPRAPERSPQYKPPSVEDGPDEDYQHDVQICTPPGNNNAARRASGGDAALSSNHYLRAPSNPQQPPPQPGPPAPCTSSLGPAANPRPSPARPQLKHRPPLTPTTSSSSMPQVSPSWPDRNAYEYPTRH